MPPKVYAVSLVLFVGIGVAFFLASQDPSPPGSATGSAMIAGDSDQGRILRRRDVFPKIDNPEIVPASEAEFLGADDEVLGLVVNGQPRAYPVHAMAYHHIVNDTVEDQPVVVTYCSVCSSGIAFDPVVDGVRKLFHFEGIWQGSMLMSDQQTRSDWLHLTGKCIGGVDDGVQLRPLSVRHVRWQEWIRDHPDSDVMRVDTSGEVYGTKSNTHRGNEYIPSYFLSTIKDRSNVRDPMELVLGVTVGDTHKAYPLAELLKEEGCVVNDEVEGVPLIVGLDQQTSSPFAYVRQLGETVLTLKANGALLTGEATDSVFNHAGVCTSGRDEGKQLQTLKSVQAKWYGWFAAHPDTHVWAGSRTGDGSKAILRTNH